MTLYRKRPVEVEALRLTADNLARVASWCGGHTEKTAVPDTTPPEWTTSLVVWTPHGRVLAVAGDWVVRDLVGTFYPCTDEVFRLNHEVEESDDGHR